MSPIESLVLAHASRQQMARIIADLCVRPDAECFYFGCLDRPGHYLSTRRGRRVVDAWDAQDTLTRVFGGIDGKLCWNSPPPGDRGSSYDRDETEGLALITHRADKSGDWTALAFWDRSVDRRGACNSAFFCRGQLTFAQMVRVARTVWPEVWARFNFPIVQVDRTGRRVS